MPVPLIPIFIALGSAAAGGIAGALSRQPEINRLRKQVELLQKQIDKLQKIIEEQNRQIQELKIRYNTLKGYEFTKRIKGKAKTRGYVMQQYALKEYIELCCLQVKKINISEEEKLFFNTYENMLNAITIEKENKIKMREYLLKKYSYEIENLILIDEEKLLSEVEGV